MQKMRSDQITEIRLPSLDEKLNKCEANMVCENSGKKKTICFISVPLRGQITCPACLSLYVKIKIKADDVITKKNPK